MRYRGIFAGILLSIFFLLGSHAQQNDFPELIGPYLGQKPPGMKPEIFAPGILNTEKMGAFCSVFSPDGDEFYFVHYEKENESSGGISWMKRNEDVWTEPEMLPFNSTETENDMCLSVNGKKLYFRSWRALPGNDQPEDRSYLWFVERTEKGWSKAKPLLCGGVPVQTGYPSIAANGNLYFARRYVEVFGIYCARPVQGVYSTPEHVFTAVDLIVTEGDMFVAPDESYMIISCWDHPDNIGSGQGDLYITFKKDDGSWTEEINMGESINTPYGENCPQVSPDGKYFFFNRYNPDAKEGNIYWVDAKIIEVIKPKDDFPVLKGPYIGQKPPGLTPEVFAPGIISTEEKYELNSVFSPRGDEFYYEISTTTQEEKIEGEYFYIIMASKQVNGIWTMPKMVPFSGQYSTMDMCFSTDGNRLYFTSDRPSHSDPSAKNHLWYVDRLKKGWSEPKILGPPIFSPESTQSQPSVASDGTIYFRIGDDLFYSKNIDGEYSKPISLGSAINSRYPEGKPFISPDESYLLFIRYGMPASIDGGRGLYISFKKEDGSWTPAKNTNISGSLPKLTPDGKYFFFSRGGDIYWVDAQIIYELKPEIIR
jgi:Tol biopolymer transport system component